MRSGSRFNKPARLIVGLALVAYLIYRLSGGGGSGKQALFQKPAASAPASQSQAPATPSPSPAEKPPPPQTATPDERVAIFQEVRGFVAAAYGFDYQSTQTTSQRVQPYVTPSFTGVLPDRPSSNSLAGKSLAAAHTVAKATIAKDADIAVIHLSGQQASVRALVTLASTSGGHTSSRSFTRHVDLTLTHTGWLVDSLLED